MLMKYFKKMDLKKQGCGLTSTQKFKLAEKKKTCKSAEAWSNSSVIPALRLIPEGHKLKVSYTTS